MEKLELLSLWLQQVKGELNLSNEEVLRIMNQPVPAVPITVFQNRNRGMLEATVVYLKDIHKLTYHEIATLLNRDDRTIWTSYQKGRRK